MVDSTDDAGCSVTLSKLKLALLAVLTLTPTGKDHDKCLCFVTAFRSFLPVSVRSRDSVYGTCFCW